MRRAGHPSIRSAGADHSGLGGSHCANHGICYTEGAHPSTTAAGGVPSMRSQRTHRAIGYAILALSILAIGVVWFASPDSGQIPLYMMAGDESGGTVRVDVMINGEIRFHSIRGDAIPYIGLAPGRYVIRCSAPGYQDGVDSFQIRASDSEAYAYCAMRRRVGDSELRGSRRQRP